MFIKYLFDRIVALFGLVVLAPVMLIVALLVRIKTPGGPVLFRQKRVGKDGKLFTMCKFRTMSANHGGSSVSVAGEARITPLGAKLRKFKLDELPELWNVFVGDMSFVGPRPDVPGYADQLTGEDRVVLRLRPGITGPATLKYRNEEEQIAQYVAEHKGQDGLSDEQLSIRYNDTIIYPDKVRINRYYYHHYSFWMDIKIIFATVLGKRIVYDGELI